MRESRFSVFVIFVASVFLHVATVDAVQFGAGTGSGYPSILDTTRTYTNKGGGACTPTDLTRICSELVNDAQSALVNIETELGLLPKGTYASVRARLDATITSGTANTWTATQTISNTAPSLVLTDTTALAKSLTIDIDANLAQLRESAGASGSLLTLDLANNRAGVGTASPVTKFQVGVGNTSADTAVGKFNTFDTDVAALELSNWDGAAATYGPRIHFDNSGVGNWYIGGSNGANNFDIATTWGTPIIRIQSGGNVGIGTTSPNTKLAVSGTTRIINAKLQLSDAAEANAVALGYIATNKLGLGNTATNDVLVVDAGTGNVGIGTTGPTFQLQLSTDSAAKPTTNTWTIASDARMKDPLKQRPYERGLDLIRALPAPHYWTYNGMADTPEGEESMGWNAQDLELIAPKMVHKTKGKLTPARVKRVQPDGTVILDPVPRDIVRALPEINLLGVNTHELQYSLFNAVRELDARVKALEARP